ncbi:hypothetical protein AB837_00497 [bacterium AB1]|nr:hypothetical protein AB837_00497 [bacterium AB1]
MVIGTKELKQQKIWSCYSDIRNFLNKNKETLSQEDKELYDKTLSTLFEIKKSIRNGLSNVDNTSDGETYVEDNMLYVDDAPIKINVFKDVEVVYPHEQIKNSQNHYFTFVTHLIANNINGIKSEYILKKEVMNQGYLNEIIDLLSDTFSSLSMSQSLNMKNVFSKICVLKIKAKKQKQEYDKSLQDYLDLQLSDYLFKQYCSYQYLQCSLLSSLDFISNYVNKLLEQNNNPQIKESLDSITANILSCVYNDDVLFEEKDGKILIGGVEIVNKNSHHYSKYLSFVQDEENHSDLYDHLSSKMQVFCFSLPLYDKYLKSLYQILICSEFNIHADIKSSDDEQSSEERNESDSDDEQGSEDSDNDYYKITVDKIEAKLKSLDQLIKQQKQEDDSAISLIVKDFKANVHAQILDSYRGVSDTENYSSDDESLEQYYKHSDIEEGLNNTEEESESDHSEFDNDEYQSYESDSDNKLSDDEQNNNLDNTNKTNIENKININEEKE